MINKRFFFIVICLLFFSRNYSQTEKDTSYLRLHLKFKEKPLQLQKKYVANTDTLAIETFKFYLSDIEVQFSDHSKTKTKSNHHLIDIENPNSMIIPIAKRQNKTISKISFNIGIDSTASVSGALGGALDPANGMYWAWQSGYINMKIEGTSNRCKTRKNQFHFHLGGYLKPNCALRTIVLEATNPSENIAIAVDLEKLLSAIQLEKNNSIMIPGKEAMIMSDLASKMFSIDVL